MKVLILGANGMLGPWLSNILKDDHEIIESDLNEIDQFKEIDESFKILNSITGKLKFRLFGYPYGKLNTINNITFKCLEKLNVDAAFLYNESKLGLEYNQKNRSNK